MLGSPKKSERKSHKGVGSLKKSIVNATGLSFPNHIGYMMITADAINVGIGVCLHQIQNGEYRPLGLLYKSCLKPKEERVLLKKNFKQSLRDLLDPGNVTIFTDHKPNSNDLDSILFV